MLCETNTSSVVGLDCARLGSHYHARDAQRGVQATYHSITWREVMGISDRGKLHSIGS